MGRRNIAFFLPSEGGPRVAGSNYEVRIYVGTSKASGTLATIYADDTNAATLTQPLHPNAGAQSQVATGFSDPATSSGVQDSTGFQVGDEVPIRDGANQIFRTLTSAAANTLQWSAGSTNGPWSSSTVIGDPMMKGWLNAWVDDTADYTIEVKNVSTGRVLPRGSIPLRAPNSNANVRANSAVAQSIPNNAFTALALELTRFDSLGTQHSNVTNNTRLTCQVTGKYQISGCAAAVANATGFRGLRVWLNGTTEIVRTVIPAVSSSVETSLNVSTVYSLSAGDFLELQWIQNSGAALNTAVDANSTTEFGMVKVSD